MALRPTDFKSVVYASSTTRPKGTGDVAVQEYTTECGRVKMRFGKRVLGLGASEERRFSREEIYPQIQIS